MESRVHILSIAGFDPSAGAGLLADIKTFEQIRCYGLSVCTANTIQNDVSFKACHWVEISIIKSQIDSLFERFKIDYAKIGIVENWLVLKELVDALLDNNPKIKIVLDPILKSSSDFDFHASQSIHLDEVLDKIYLLTPNYLEIQQLYADKNREESIQHIMAKTNLFLKGGHRPENVGVDELFTVQNTTHTFQPTAANCTTKHGSGCVLSSAITGYLGMGLGLITACKEGKKYSEGFLCSNTALLGYHNI